MKKIIGGIFVAGIVVLAVYLLLPDKSERGLGSAPPGLTATYATSSIRALSADSSDFLFATTTNCANRTVTSPNADLKISFSSIATTTFETGSIIGQIQKASSTVTYDSGLYGCGYWMVQSIGQGQNVIVTEFR